MKQIMTVILVILALSLSPLISAGQGRTQSTIDGNAMELLAPTDSGEISVISQSDPDDQGSISFALRNDSNSAASWLKAVVTVSDPSGNVLAIVDSDSSSSIQPYRIDAGEVGIGYVLIGGIGSYEPFPEGTTFTITFAPTDEEIVFPYRDFEVSDFEGDADGIEGTLSASQVDYPGSGDFVSVIVACFDENGTVSGSWTVVIEDVVEPGSNTKISTQPDNGVSDCDRFLVAAGDL